MSSENFQVSVYDEQKSYPVAWNTVDKYINTEKAIQVNHHEYSAHFLDSTQTTAETSLASSRNSSFFNKEDDAKNSSDEFADKFLKSAENNTYSESDDEQNNNYYKFFGFQQPSCAFDDYPQEEQFNTQNIPTIEMDSFTEVENILQQKNQKIDVVRLHKTIPTKTKKSYEHKNVLKILGQKLISLIFENYYESKKKNILEELLRENQNDVALEIERRELFEVSISDFKNYLKTQEIKKKYTKIKTFKEFWRVGGNYQSPRLEVYRRLLAQITRKFLEEDVYHILIQNKGPKPIKKEGKIFGYLQKVPILLRGMNDPEHFTNLDD